jgi:hypothetical protein
VAVTYLTGFESQDTSNVNLAPFENLTITGSAVGARSTQHRTGAYGLRINPISGQAGYVTLGVASNYQHFGLYLVTLPSLDRLLFGAIAAGTINVRLKSTGVLDVYVNTTLIGSTSALSLTTWYWIGIRQVTGTSVAFLQVDGLDSVTGTATVSAVSAIVGCSGTEASGLDIWFDDLIGESVGLLAPSNVALLVPTSDNAVGTGWTLGTGTAISSNGFTAVKNTPPLGVADLAAGSDVKQIRNASANANVNYDANLTTYTAAGINVGDTVLVVLPVTATAAPVTTSSKQGTVGVASNPTITNIALGAGGTPGAFWSGAAGATYVTGWKISRGTLTTSPSVTLGTAPVMRITQVTSSTRIAVVCFMGMYVAWTPGNRYPRALNANQARNRAASF